MIKYGQTIIYSDFDSVTSCGVDGGDSAEEARNEAIRLATADGWTNPTWWQWWRWGDTKFTKREIKEALGSD